MKTGVLITARLKSTRLPLKLLHYINGKRVIDHVIERAKAIHMTDRVILCTSPDPQDLPLVEAAKAHGIYYFTGDPDDVLRRLYDAATFFGLDYILNATADDVFFSVEYANLLANEALRKKPDFMYVDGLPIGITLYGLRYEALKTVMAFKNEADTEIWGLWFNHPDLFEVSIPQARPEDRRDVRLTLDTYEDLQFLQRLGERLPAQAGMSYHALLRVIDGLDADCFTNRNVVQKQLAGEIKAKIDALYTGRRDELLELKRQIYKK